MSYVVGYDDKKYTLEPDDCGFFMNDEEKPLMGIDVKAILAIMDGSDQVCFQKAYYDQACEGCRKNRQEGAKYFEFLEFHYYLFGKEGQYVMSSLSPEYEGKSLQDLLGKGLVDSSYIVSINVCQVCGDYTIDLENGFW